MRNFTVGRVWGIPIRLNVSLVVFLPILAWLIGSGGQIALYASLVNGFAPRPLDVATLTAGATPWVIGVAAAVGLFVSVALHELGHSWMGMRFGFTVESITLWILGGIASFTEMPREWNRELLVAVAGPATSVLVAAGCYLVVQTVPASPVVVFVFGWLVVTNVTLAVFNMLPAFPMDGGRVLRALLARSRPYPVATRIAASVGIAFAFLFALVGVLQFSPLLLLLALFVYGAAKSESRTVLLTDLLEGLHVADLAKLDRATVSETASLSDLSDRMFRERQTEFLVTDESDAVVGAVTLEGLKRLRRTEADRTVGDVAIRDLPRLSATDDAFSALVALNQQNTPFALVEDDGGDVVGSVSLADFTAVLQLRQQLPRASTIDRSS